MYAIEIVDLTRRLHLHFKKRLQPWCFFLESIKTCKSLYECDGDHKKEGEKKECNSHDQPSNSKGNIWN